MLEGGREEFPEGDYIPKVRLEEYLQRRAAGLAPVEREILQSAERALREGDKALRPKERCDTEEEMARYKLTYDWTQLADRLATFLAINQG